MCPAKLSVVSKSTPESMHGIFAASQYASFCNMNYLCSTSCHNETAVAKLKECGSWQCSAQARDPWSRSHSFDRSNTLFPINYDSCIAGGPANANWKDASADALAKAKAAGKTGCEVSHNWRTERGFKSQHPGVVTVMMADGSVHTVAETADHFLFNRLGCRGDQLVAGVGSL